VDGHVDGFPEKPPSAPLEFSGSHGRLLTVSEVAERLSVSRATVYNLTSCGALPHLRVSNAIRVRQSSLESYLAENAGPARS